MIGGSEETTYAGLGQRLSHRGLSLAHCQGKMWHKVMCYHLVVLLHPHIKLNVFFTPVLAVYRIA
jgi:hypothetical protein